MKTLAFVIGLVAAPIGSLCFILGAFGDSHNHMLVGILGMAVSVYLMNYVFNGERK